MADRPDRPRRSEVPLPPMPAAWRDPADGGDRPGPRPPSLPHRASGPPAPPAPPRVVRPPRPPQMVPPRFTTPPVTTPSAQRSYREHPGPASGPGMPTYTPQPLTSVVPVTAPRPRPVSPIPYPGLPLSVPPMGPGTAPGVAAAGFDPRTGEPLSDRSSLTAGLLQIFLGVVGAGRIYTGHVALALLQMGTGLALVMFTLCVGSGLGLSAVAATLWVGLAWPVVDGIVLLGWGGRDGNGHRLR